MGKIMRTAYGKDNSLKDAENTMFLKPHEKGRSGYLFTYFIFGKVAFQQCLGNKILAKFKLKKIS